ncbi:MAG TPA: thiamine pyrophosphate-binding protein, partial [Gaiellaceae bacterium]|nr:thiamine pyrophosphate-binding protein [Gaiellaceae bacterium]
METVNVGRAVVDVLQAEGVRFVFGLPGGHVLSVYDALYATPEIRHVLVRHEQAATQALAGAGRPLLVAGGGAVAADASAGLVEPAGLLAAPVLTSLAGRSSVPAA